MNWFINLFLLSLRIGVVRSQCASCLKIGNRSYITFLVDETEVPWFSKWSNFSAKTIHVLLAVCSSFMIVHA